MGEYIYIVRDEYCKNKQKLIFHHNFQINLLFVKDTDGGHYVCDLLDYKILTWWIWDNIINNYSGYPDNVYNYLS